MAIINLFKFAGAKCVLQRESTLTVEPNRIKSHLKCIKYFKAGLSIKYKLDELGFMKANSTLLIVGIVIIR